MVRPCRDLDGPCTVLQVYYLLDRVQLAVELVARFVHGAEPAFPEPPHLPGPVPCLPDPVPCLLNQRRGALAIAGDWLARRVLARPAARREVWFVAGSRAPMHTSRRHAAACSTRPAWVQSATCSGRCPGATRNRPTAQRAACGSRTSSKSVSYRDGSSSAARSDRTARAAACAECSIAPVNVWSRDAPRLSWP